MVITTQSFNTADFDDEEFDVNDVAEWPDPREEDSEGFGENDNDGEPGAVNA